MKRLVFLSLLSLFILSSPLSAESTFKGQKVYLKECRVCHMGSKIFINTHTFYEWEKILDINGSSLSHIHLSKDVKYVKTKDGDTVDSHSYFNSERYKNSYEDLRPFIMRFAKKN